jgi:KUP system potassium uptake protein
VHTNEAIQGQIYVPAVNWAYLLACIALVVVFKSSHNLAPAYGLAVTGTMAITTIMFFLVATRVWKWNPIAIGALCIGLVLVDLAFFVSNAIQFFEGGYVTILIATVCAFVMLTWRAGRAELASVLQRAALPVDLFLSSLKEEKPPRVHGTAVFMTSNAGVPPSLTHYFKHAKTLHEQLMLLTVQTKSVPAVPDAKRVEEVVHHGEGVYGVRLTYGFMETPDIPKVLGQLCDHGIAIDQKDVSYFLGRESLVFTGKSKMSHPRKVFFKVMSQNAVAASAFFKLPPGRVVELGMQVEI